MVGNDLFYEHVNDIVRTTMTRGALRKLGFVVDEAIARKCTDDDVKDEDELAEVTFDFQWTLVQQECRRG
eukprot:1688848-Pyramimonas_sp.AAC.1